MGWLGYLLVAVLAYGAFLAAGLPASVALQHLDRPAGVAWERAAGTVWEGRLEGVAARGGSLDEVAWRLDPWRLLLARAGGSLRVEAPGFQVHGEVAVSLISGDAVVSDVRGQADGSGATRALGLPVPVAGAFTLELARLGVSGDGPPAGSGTLQWRGARVAAAPALELGSVRASLDGSRVDVSGRGEDVDVEGWVELTAGPGYRLDITFVPTASAGPGPARLLATFARAQGDGSHRLRLQGAL